MSTRQQTRTTAPQQILIPIVIDPEDEPEDPIVDPTPDPPQPEPTPTEPEIPQPAPRPGGEKIPPGGWRGAETPRPGGEKIPPGGWRGAETPRPGGEKIPPGGWRGAETPRPGGEKIPPGGWRMSRWHNDESLNPGDWRNTSRLPILIPIDEPPLNSWDGEVYRTTDGLAYFHFKTTIVAHIIPPEEAGTGSVFATLVEYWTSETGLVTIEAMTTDDDSIPAFTALARMSTHVTFAAAGPEEIHQAFTQLQSQLGVWAETLWGHIHERDDPIDYSGEQH